MDQMNVGSDWLAKKLKQHASKSVRYRRGDDFVDLAATLGKTEFLVVGNDEAITRVHTRDFLVTTAELKLNDDIVTLPQTGDTITETIAGNSETYRVSAPENEMPYRYQGQHKHMLRIHTQRVT